jgi:hypothetical protein
MPSLETAAAQKGRPPLVALVGPTGRCRELFWLQTSERWCPVHWSFEQYKECRSTILAASPNLQPQPTTPTANAQPPPAVWPRQQPTPSFQIPRSNGNNPYDDDRASLASSTTVGMGGGMGSERSSSELSRLDTDSSIFSNGSVSDKGVKEWREHFDVEEDEELVDSTLLGPCLAACGGCPVLLPFEPKEGLGLAWQVLVLTVAWLSVSVSPWICACKGDPRPRPDLHLYQERRFQVKHPRSVLLYLLPPISEHNAESQLFTLYQASRRRFVPFRRSYPMTSLSLNVTLSFFSCLFDSFTLPLPKSLPSDPR